MASHSNEYSPGELCVLLNVRKKVLICVCDKVQTGQDGATLENEGHLGRVLTLGTV